MPSFDVVNEIDVQELDNAVNNTKKEVATRYDFRESKTEIDFNRKEKKLHITTEDDMKMRAIQDMLVTHCVRRKVDPKCLEFKDIEPTSNMMIKRDVTIKDGIEKEAAKKIVKIIKDMNLKQLQAAIQDSQVRVTSKNIDDLQIVIKTLKDSDVGLPLQFVNMKR